MVSIQGVAADVAQIIALWVITLFMLIGLFLRYKGTCYFHLRSDRIWFRCLLKYTSEPSTWSEFSKLNMKAALSSEMSALTYYRTWCDILAGRHLD